jgi:hypothetical protein
LDAFDETQLLIWVANKERQLSYRLFLFAGPRPFWIIHRIGALHALFCQESTAA